MNTCQKNPLYNSAIFYKPNKLFIASGVNIQNNVKAANPSEVDSSILDFASPSSATLSSIILNLKLVPTLVITYIKVNV